MELTGLLVQDREESIPLKSISVRAFLQGFVVGFRSKLTYENESSSPLEVCFRTPVDDSNAVVGLEAVIDGRKIRAEIEEKEKARTKYTDAIRSGRTAAFGEEKKGDIFSIVLGNLSPGKKAEIQLTMVGELDVEPDGSVRFVLPTVLKPRYTPSGGTDPLEPMSDREEKPVKHAEGPLEFNFDLVISEADGVAQVTSPSHKIIAQRVEQTINVNLEEDAPKDIVILVYPKEPHKPLVIVEAGLSDGKNDFQKSTAIMLSFFPEFGGDISCTQAACEFVFVIDRSGSMQGEYIHDAAQTLLLFLKSIPEGCYFNVIGFGSSYEKLFPESVPYNQDNLEKAVAHAEGLNADLGGTELFDPLKYIFGLAQMKGLPRQVFVLTDGSVSNTESVIKLVARHSHNARCFSFGIGSGASSTLVKGIAQAGRGTAEFITSGERMQPKVIRSLKKALQPAVTDTQVKFTLPDGHTVQTAPENVPPIFLGERTILYGVLKQPEQGTSSPEASVCLSGDLLGAEIKHNMKFVVPVALACRDTQRVITIHHLAAKRLIKEMESDESGKNKEKIIKLSCDGSVISSLTAFIAIDEDQKEPVEGSLQTWDIQAPEEYDLGGVYHGAPPMYMALSAPQRRFKSSAPPPPTFAARRAPAVGAALPRTRRDQSTCSGSGSGLAGQPWTDDVYDSACSEPDESYRSEATLGYNAMQSYVPRPAHTSVDKLAIIIGLQLASGAWRSTAELASIFQQNPDEMKAACPVPCQGEMEVIWATVVALTYLEQKESGQKDEWELVAGKAEAWLAKQTLPEGCSLESLRQKARDIARDIDENKKVCARDIASDTDAGESQAKNKIARDIHAGEPQTKNKNERGCVVH